VAGTRAELVRAMCEGNREQLLGALDDALGKLGVARGSLASTGSLRSMLDAGNRGRAALEAQRRRPHTRTKIDLAGTRVRDELLSLGRTGGRIVGIDGNLAVAELPDDPRSRVGNEM
jgi:prephenate dehydrogenase